LNRFIKDLINNQKYGRSGTGFCLEHAWQTGFFKEHAWRTGFAEPVFYEEAPRCEEALLCAEECETGIQEATKGEIGIQIAAKGFGETVHRSTTWFEAG